MLFRKYLFNRVGWSTLIIAAIGLLLVAASPAIYRAALGGEARDEAEAAAFRTRGVETSGKVMSSQTRTDQRNTGPNGQPQTVTIHVVTYEYHDGSGKARIASGHVSKERAAALHHNNPIPIAYLSDDPGKSRINYEPPPGSSNAGRVVAIGLGAAGTVLTLLALVHLVISWGAARHKATLVATGQVARGTVTDVAIKRGKNDVELSRSLAFEFAHENGSVYTGASEPLPRKLRESWRAGDSVRVVYNAEDPNINDVDLFDGRSDVKV